MELKSINVQAVTQRNLGIQSETSVYAKIGIMKLLVQLAIRSVNLAITVVITAQPVTLPLAQHAFSLQAIIELSP